MSFGKPRWETFEVAESASHPELDGRRLNDLAAEWGKTPFDTLLDLAVDEPTIRIGCMLANDDADEVAKVLVRDHVTLGLSDAGAHVSQLCDAPQATDFLGNWVRDRNLLPMEEAIRRLTSQQADIFGLPDRGRLVPGAWADVVVFDPETVAPGPLRRVRDFPAGSERLTADQPTGIRHVLVNGVPIQVDGVHDAEARPGQLVRPA
jgi:N-acyl-D-aspartate/D-glutamate deacylase